jgi:hypothetical protein
VTGVFRRRFRLPPQALSRWVPSATGAAATQGTMAVSTADDVLDASGTAQTAITGDLDVSLAATVLEAIGSIVAEGVVGTFSASAGPATLVAAGQAITAVSGILGVTLGDDALVGWGYTGGGEEGGLWTPAWRGSSGNLWANWTA